MMMTLGFFVFSLPTASYQSLQRQMSWNHAEQQRPGARPAYQYVGPGSDSISLQGVLYPEITGGRVTLDLLRVMAEEGKAWPLIEGTGRIYGFWAITGINETSSEFMQDGAPRKIEFDLSLVRVDEKRIDLLSTGINAALAGATGIMAAPLNKLRGRINSVGDKLRNPLSGL